MQAFFCPGGGRRSSRRSSWLLAPLVPDENHPSIATAPFNISKALSHDFSARGCTRISTSPNSTDSPIFFKWKRRLQNQLHHPLLADRHRAGAKHVRLFACPSS